MRKLILLGFLALLVATASTISAPAPDAGVAAEAKQAAEKAEREKAAEEMQKVEGTVVSTDPKAGSFVVKQVLRKGNVNKEITFTLAERPKVLVDGKPAGLDDLKSGDPITVRFKRHGAKFVAHVIEVRPPKPPPKKGKK